MPNEKKPSLSDLGLDEPAEKDQFSKVFESYENKDEVAPNWVDSVKLPESPTFNAAIAALLSFVLPGAGQAYKLHIVSAFFWLIVTVALYCGPLPLPFVGILVHVACMVFAAYWPK